VTAAFFFDGSRAEPDLTIANLHGEGRHVVGERVKRAAAREVEFGVVPVAGEDAVLDGAPMKRESHVRAAVVQGEHAPIVEENQDGPPVDRDNLPAFPRELRERADFYSGS
jgi:hypothetical protein